MSSLKISIPTFLKQGLMVGFDRSFALYLRKISSNATTNSSRGIGSFTWPRGNCLSALIFQPWYHDLIIAFKSLLQTRSQTCNNDVRPPGMYATRSQSSASACSMKSFTWWSLYWAGAMSQTKRIRLPAAKTERANRQEEFRPTSQIGHVKLNVANHHNAAHQGTESARISGSGSL